LAPNHAHDFFPFFPPNGLAGLSRRSAKTPFFMCSELQGAVSFGETLFLISSRHLFPSSLFFEWPLPTCPNQSLCASLHSQGFLLSFAPGPSRGRPHLVIAFSPPFKWGATLIYLPLHQFRLPVPTYSLFPQNPTQSLFFSAADSPNPSRQAQQVLLAPPSRFLFCCGWDRLAR